MNLTGIHHVSIMVSDMERAVAFYRDSLGLTEVKRPSAIVTQSFSPLPSRTAVCRRWESTF